MIVIAGRLSPPLTGLNNDLLAKLERAGGVALSLEHRFMIAALIHVSFTIVDRAQERVLAWTKFVKGARSLLVAIDDMEAIGFPREKMFGLQFRDTVATLKEQLCKFGAHDAMALGWSHKSPLGRGRDHVQDMVIRYALAVYDASGGEVSFRLDDDEETVTGPTADFLGTIWDAIPIEMKPFQKSKHREDQPPKPTATNTFVRRAQDMLPYCYLPHRAILCDWIEAERGSAGHGRPFMDKPQA